MAERVAPTEQVAAGLSVFGPEQVARNVERHLARLPNGADALARAFAVLGSGHRCGTRAGSRRSIPTRREAGRRAARGRPGDRGRLALVHPLIASALDASMERGERSLLHARAARLLKRERADPEIVALHLLYIEPAGNRATVEVLWAAADRAEARGAPESAAAFLRRALAEPPPDRAGEPRSAPSWGSRSPPTHPDAPRVLAEAVADATPDSAASSRFAGPARSRWTVTSTTRSTSAGARSPSPRRRPLPSRGSMPS